jgi:hypothetical protein
MPAPGENQNFPEASLSKNAENQFLAGLQKEQCKAKSTLPNPIP